jgi:hypothetical protein
MRAANGLATLLLVAAMTSAGTAQQRFASVSSAADPGWRSYFDADTATNVQFPAGIFTVADGIPESGTGRRFKTSDGRATFSIYALPNEARESPADYLADKLKIPRAALTYQRLTKKFFAISGVHEGNIYYSRCNFAARIHCIYVAYPDAEKRAWDPVVTRISLSLRP